MSCVKYSPPDFTLDATCVGAGADYLASLVSEIGFSLKTSAVTSNVRLLRVGFFDLRSALLYKHCNLENILQNISQNESTLHDQGSPHKSTIDHNIRRSHFEKFVKN